MAHGIYKIVNTVNNKFYVGSAVNLAKRKTRHWAELRHQKHNNRHLQAAWNKYGEEVFQFVVIKELATKDELYPEENIWLQEHVGKDYCYNIGRLAEAPMLGMSGEKSPTWGLVHTPESIEKIRVASTGREHTEESKEKISAFLRGKPKSEETKTKISETMTGENHFYYGKKRPEFAVKVRKPVVAIDPNGKRHLFESIQKLREELNMTPPSVHRALESGKLITKGPRQDWRFEYAPIENP